MRQAWPGLHQGEEAHSFLSGHLFQATVQRGRPSRSKRSGWTEGEEVRVQSWDNRALGEQGHEQGGAAEGTPEFLDL